MKTSRKAYSPYASVLLPLGLALLLMMIVRSGSASTPEPLWTLLICCGLPLAGIGLSVNWLIGRRSRGEDAG